MILEKGGNAVIVDGAEYPDQITMDEALPFVAGAFVVCAFLVGCWLGGKLKAFRRHGERP